MKNTTTMAKKAKRPYVKKQLRTQDELWKAIIPALWGPFLRFCACGCVLYLRIEPLIF
jgi:hypothetical protein